MTERLRRDDPNDFLPRRMTDEALRAEVKNRLEQNDWLPTEFLVELAYRSGLRPTLVRLGGGSVSRNPDGEERDIGERIAWVGPDGAYYEAYWSNEDRGLVVRVRDGRLVVRPDHSNKVVIASEPLY